MVQNKFEEDFPSLKGIKKTGEEFIKRTNKHAYCINFVDIKTF